MKVLVVEDDPSQRTLVRMLLESQGYEVIIANNGLEALEVLNSIANLHLIITDLSMPRMDGFSLIREVRKREVSYTYIIVLTSATENVSRLKALEGGADDYLIKPVSVQELTLRLAGAERLLKLVSHQNLTFVMAKLAEYRSRETGLHLERVRLYSELLGKTYASEFSPSGFSQAQAFEVALLSPLHDIGKVAIPDKILNKPGKLTEQEMEIMKTHTTLGGTFIHEIYRKFSTPYLLLAYEIVMYHHERWDGTGYPEGLKGNSIPLSARIVALSDFYDAATSERCYKNAVPRTEVEKWVFQGKGVHFDPDLVACFMSVKDDFWRVREENREGENL